MMLNKQTGFTLVELMVAMAIGTVIILGAGQLFLTTFQTFRTVDELSRKQEALIFITGTMVQDIRSATDVSLGLDDSTVKLSILSQNGVCNEGEPLDKRYFVTESNESFSLSIRRKCANENSWGNSEPLVEGFYDASDDSFSVEELDDGLYKLTIRLATEKGQNYEEFVIHIQNRVSVFS